MIAFERYVVIVKGLSAKPMTFTKATLEILFVWVQALIWSVTVTSKTPVSNTFMFEFIGRCSHSSVGIDTCPKAI